jgi:hypothetical protein
LALRASDRSPQPKRIAPKPPAAVILSDTVVEAVRKELRRQTSFNGVEEHRRVLRSEVVRAELG